MNLFRRRSISRIAIIPTIIVAAIVAISQLTRCGSESIVVRVKDGDSIVLSDGREIRYLGIDCPEFNEPFFAEAKKFNHELVQNKKIRIEIDVQEHDDYGRTLAYVFIEDKFVNNELVKNGFAYVYSKKPNVRYTELLLASQQEALGKKIGIWQNITHDEKYYVATQNGERFHRPNCEHMKDKKNLRKFTCKEDALKEGASP